MKTIHQHVNSFEVAIVSMIMVGFVLTGLILFTGLTPRAQTQVASSLNMFDIHEQAASTVSETENIVGLVMDVPNEFYNQFYIAFTQVAVLPPETFSVPVAAFNDISNQVYLSVNALSDQVAQGYLAQNSIATQQAGVVSQAAQVAMTGKVMGAVIDITDEISSLDVPTNLPQQPKLMLPYVYKSPDLADVKLSLTKYLK